MILQCLLGNTVVHEKPIGQQSYVHLTYKKLYTLHQKEAKETNFNGINPCHHLVRNADYWVPPQTSWIQIYILSRSPVTHVHNKIWLRWLSSPIPLHGRMPQSKHEMGQWSAVPSGVSFLKCVTPHWVGFWCLKGNLDYTCKTWLHCFVPRLTLSSQPNGSI